MKIFSNSNNKILQKIIAALITISVATVFSNVSVKAQEEGGLRLSVSPLPINLSTTPGSVITTDLKVQNSGSKSEQIEVGLLKFSADSQTGSPVLGQKEVGDEHFDWVKFSPNIMTLEPNQWGTVKMTIEVPNSAAFGYYYAVTFSRAEQAQPQGGSTTLQGAAATLVLLEVDVPGAKREVEVESFKTSRSWYEFLPVEFLIQLRNSGNVHVAPFGSVFIEKNGEQVATLQVNSAKGNILPDSPRTFSVNWDNGFPVYKIKQKNGQTILDDRGEPLQELSWNFTQADKMHFGKYTAKLVMAYDNGQRDVPIESEIEFWIIPWRIIVGVLIVALLMASGIYFVARSLWRRSSDDRGE